MALTRRRRLERLDTRTRSRRSAASGYTNEYLVRRLWCGAKQYEIGAGTSEIRGMLIGRELYAETM